MFPEKVKAFSSKHALGNTFFEFGGRANFGIKKTTEIFCFVSRGDRLCVGEMDLDWRSNAKEFAFGVV